MTPLRRVDAAAARRFLVLRHHLAPPRALPAGPEGVLAVVERVGSLQFDPLAVAGRNHDLVLHARVREYDPRWVDDLLYGRRLLFEALNKGLSLLPTHELPWYRITWERRGAAHAGGTFQTHADLVDRILERIRRDGPISSLDLGHGATIDWYWGPTSSHRAVLEALSEAGLLGLARREGNRRYYDLIERLFPADLLATRVDEREQLLHKLLSRYRGQGLLGASGPAELWGGIRPAEPADGGPAEPADGGQVPETTPAATTRAALLAELIERGDLVPLEVEGCRGRRHVLATELPILEQAEREVAAAPAAERPAGLDPQVTFLAPLDPFVWDRDLLHQLFAFDYTWEVYVPAARRRWGYYVLPVLFGDRLVGRIEPRIERPSGAIRLLHLWWEPGFDPLEAPGFVDALAVALDAYRRFGGADVVQWPGDRSARTLARAVAGTGLLRVRGARARAVHARARAAHAGAAHARGAHAGTAHARAARPPNGAPPGAP